MNNLVLSLFPGIGMLDRAFEEEGFCIVRGPDLLWGGDVRGFHPPPSAFDGVIGGPPCQAFSQMRFINANAGRHGNLIPEFERVVREAAARWFLMENVKDAPIPEIHGYISRSLLLNNRWLGEDQNRLRRFTFGTPSGVPLAIDVAAFESPVYHQAATSASVAVPVALVRDGRGGHRPKRSIRPPTISGGHSAVMSHDRGNISIEEMCRLQGLPGDFLSESPFTAHGKRRVIGNGVPLPMGRAIARSIRHALEAVA